MRTAPTDQTVCQDYQARRVWSVHQATSPLFTWTLYAIVDCAILGQRVHLENVVQLDDLDLREYQEDWVLLGRLGHLGLRFVIHLRI